MECGTPIPQVKKCAGCGKELDLSAKFCPECGAKQEINIEKLTPEEMFDMSQKCMRDGKTADGLKWIRKSAEAGNAIGQYCLGLVYMYGDPNNILKKDTSEAEFWLKKAATQGLPDAQYNLGYLYCLEMPMLDLNNAGKWVSEGQKWLKMAAEKGDEKAKQLLLNMGVNV